MKFYAVAFVYTLQCSGSCDICCFSCSQDKKERLSVEKIQEIIDDLPQDIKLIGFTGGECFLFYDELLKVIQHAAQRGLQTTITTNCFWAENDEVVYKRFKELSTCNIRSIKISIDEFHLGHVPLENIKRFLRIGKSLSFKIVIGCTILKNSKKIGSYLECFEDELASIPFVEHCCYPLGNAAAMDEQMFYKYPQITTRCFEGGMLTITPEGNAYPCGSMCGIIDERSVGNIYHEGIATLLEKAQNDEVNNYLYENGTSELVDKLKKEGIIPLERCYVDGCHACFEVFKEISKNKIVDVIHSL